MRPSRHYWIFPFHYCSIQVEDFYEVVKCFYFGIFPISVYDWRILLCWPVLFCKFLQLRNCGILADYFFIFGFKCYEFRCFFDLSLSVFGQFFGVFSLNSGRFRFPKMWKGDCISFSFQQGGIFFCFFLHPRYGFS